jgi:transposase InsO family protein
VPILADRGLYICFEQSFYRLLNAHGQAHHRGRARLPQEPRPVPWLEALRPNQVWSWDNTYQPSSVRGVWSNHYLVIDVWSRKVVAWNVADRGEALIATDLFSQACLRERISKGRPKLLILNTDNGNAVRTATLESRLEELGVLRSFSRPRVSNDNPYLESLFHTVKYRPDYPPTAIHQRGEGMHLGGGVGELVQRSAPAQWYPIRDAIATPQRRSSSAQPSPWSPLRTDTPTPSPPLESNHRLLVSAGGGLDQSTAGQNRRSRS